jgi:hypothetical protein
MDAPLVHSGWSWTFHSGTVDAALTGGVHSIAYVSESAIFVVEKAAHVITWVQLVVFNKAA